MSRKPPKLYPPLLFFVGAGIAWTISGYTGPRWQTNIAYIVTFAMIGGVILSGLDYLTYTIARRWNDFAETRYSPRIKMNEAETAKLRALEALDSDHLAAMGKFISTIETVPGTGMIPLHYLRVGDEMIDFEFIDEFLRVGGRQYLAPVRRWSEGSTKRRWAEELTRFWVANQFAEEANGNQPARWLDRAGGLASIGLSEEE